MSRRELAAAALTVLVIGGGCATNPAPELAGAGDLSGASVDDLARVDGAADLARPSDLEAADLATAPDLEAADLEAPDLEAADLAAPDLAAPDLAAPDLAPPDLAAPDLAHLAHTTWFFEEMVLARRAGYRPFHPAYGALFNSYYDSVGSQWPRAERGVLSRPTVDEVLAYRRHVDAALVEPARGGLPSNENDEEERVTLGLHHEQQHQELLLTDLKHALSLNPLGPAYRAAEAARTAAGSDPGGGVPASSPAPLGWVSFAGGVVAMGDAGRDFAFDNERPRHRVLVEPFRLATRLVTAAELAAFIDDRGYERPLLWLSDGWATVEREAWRAPLYWRRDGDGWSTFTLGGWRPVAPDEPACHLSFYEADAFARWAGARLPTEAEWEHAAAGTLATPDPRALPLPLPVPLPLPLPDAGFVESGVLHPSPAPRRAGLNQLTQLFGECWQWTRSAYAPYPGYRPPPGPLGEYNGKFMCSQMVLRGASCVTPRSHARLTYRNFFPPAARWQFTGVRLAADA